jgi:hypothetical protein
LDAFHNSIGEFLFPIWIVAFLLIVLNIEDRLQAKARRTILEKERTITTVPDREDSSASHPTIADARGA